MRWQREDGRTGPEDAATLAALDRALDELAADGGRWVGEAAALAALAGELQDALPEPPPGAAERGRAAFLARAAELHEAAPANDAGRVATPASDGSRVARPAAAADRVARPVSGAGQWRGLPLRVAALAAALVLVAAVPAAVARQAEPGTALWPMRQVGQQLRVQLADGPVHRAHLRLNTAEEYLAAGAGAGEERRKEMADRAEDQIENALDQLEDVAGPEAAAGRARAEQLLLGVRALEHQDDPADDSGPGSGSGPGDNSGSGRSDDSSRTGSGSSGSGSGSSGSGPRSSGKGRGGPGDG